MERVSPKAGEKVAAGKEGNGEARENDDASEQGVVELPGKQHAGHAHHYGNEIVGGAKADVSDSAHLTASIDRTMPGVCPPHWERSQCPPAPAHE